MKRLTDIEILNMYYFSKEGKVFNKTTNKELKPQINSRGYMVINLCIRSKKRKVRVHRFVAYQHIPNINGYPYINHKDCDKTNNHVENLEWCTYDMNKNHAIENGLYKKNSKYGENNKLSKMRDEEVKDIRRLIKEGNSYRDIYSKYEYKIGWWSFRDICRGKTWKHLL